MELAPAGQTLDFLSAIGRKLGSRAILIPTSDTAALFVAAHAGVLRKWFRFSEMPFGLVQSLYSKKDMYFLAKQKGIPTPNSVFPESRCEALAFSEEARYPVMLKAVEARLAKPGSGYTKVIVRNKQELLDNYGAMAAAGDPNIMLQEYIPGGEDCNWMFNGYFDEHSECLFGLTGKKIRQNRPYAGITSLGVCLDNVAVHRSTTTFMKQIGYRGILDIGFRYDARDGLYKVFDINPRIGCTFRLFVSSTGMDVTRALYLNLTGQPIRAGAPLPGRKWVVEDLDLASAFRYWSDGNLGINQWIRSFRGVQEFGIFARDDLRPVLSMFLSSLREVRHRLRRARLTPAFLQTPRPEFARRASKR
jgi:predicted ATP-grasp superfamily ATP-dependent carboligase